MQGTLCVNRAPRPEFLVLSLVCAAMPFTASAQSWLSRPPGPLPSIEVRRIVTSLKINSYDLDVSALPKADRKDIAALDKDPALEKYRVPIRPATSDVMVYTVYFDKARGRYWVQCNGGFAGSMDLYGPAKAPYQQPQRPR